MKIIDWNNIDENTQNNLLGRPSYSNRQAIGESVSRIIDTVKLQKDKAIKQYTRQYDGVLLNDCVVSAQEFKTAELMLNKVDKVAIETAIERIENYQRALLPTMIEIDTQDGIKCQRIPRPIERVGLYVPGGSAPLVSTLMMLAIPAKLAACPIRVVCTPPNQNGEINPLLLATAKRCGIDTIYKIGGIQAVAAMAYGTETVVKVDKLFGPGNRFVTEAKIQISQDPTAASIDMPAGPSELLVIADKTANCEYIAADLLSQAEHDVDSQVLLVTDTKKIAENTIQAIRKQLNFLSRQLIAEKSLQNCRIILVGDIQQAIELSNRYAPEHLMVQVNDAEAYLSTIRNVGAIFIGAFTPETMGDYINGANHVLPTASYARSVSGLSVSDFMQIVSVQRVNVQGLKKYGPHAMRLAEIEGLDAHKNAVAIRMENT